MKVADAVAELNPFHGLGHPAARAGGPAACCGFFLASGCVGTSSTNLPESLQCQNRPALLRATPMSFSVWLGIP